MFENVVVFCSVGAVYSRVGVMPGCVAMVYSEVGVEYGSVDVVSAAVRYCGVCLEYLLVFCKVAVYDSISMVYGCIDGSL